MIKSGTMKPGRVKVGVRCRPAFQDEIDFAKGEFLSIVDIKPEDKNQSSFGQISLTLISGKQREFSYDYAFHTNATQDYVYDRIARPVVTDVLKGFNGTIFAYGQTGTGKTYTMGILEFVSNEHAGIIPRAISQIFEHVEGQDTAEVSVSLSFLQLYRETIQDLLSPAAANGSALSSGDENLAIREDPQRGFFVEGLQEFTVRSYREAEALINLGLENRAIAPTLMNVTSSRSHTVLTLNIEQRITGDGTSAKSYSKTLRSKLLMVDLAGSERVRRTVSKGTRLSEAKSINTSLSALGNVIAALAEQNVSHVPYRDSKLTRLLQDSLGGTASTALIATVGPAAVNYGETLSTLLFASRCMAVKITPVQHEEVDYAEMCAQLQAQVNAMEGAVTARLEAQQQAHEKAIRELSQTFEMEKSLVVQQEFASAQQTTAAARAAFDTELNSILDRLERAAGSNVDGSSTLGRWLGKPVGWKGSAQELSRPDARLVALLGYSFEIVSYLSNTMSDLMRQNLERDEQQHSSLLETFRAAGQSEAEREREIAAMERNDPQVVAGGDRDDDAVAIGSHLAPLSRLEAMTRVEGKFRSNNAPTSPFDRLVDASAAVKVSPRPAIYNYKDADEIAVALASMHSSIRQNASSLSALLVRKDSHYQAVKGELTEQMVEKRKREEEVINWSYILKYLLASSSKLRKQLQREKKVQAALAHMHTTSISAVANSASDAQRLVPESSVSSLFGQAASTSAPSVLRRYEVAESPSSTSEVDSDEAEEEADMSERFSEVTGATGLTNSMAPFGGFKEALETQLPPLPVPRVNKSSALPPVTPSSTFRASQSAGAATDAMSEMSMSPLDAVRFRRDAQTSDQRFHDQPPHIQYLHQQPQQTRQVRADSAASDPRRGLRVPEAVGSVDEDMEGNSDDELSVDMRSAASSITRSVAGNSLYSQQTSRSVAPTPLTNSITVAHLQPRNQGPDSGIRRSQQVPQRDRAVASAPSAFAEEVVRSLGVEQQQAAAAMSIVDQVSRITPEQLRLLDPETRAQILQIRKDLKLDPAPSISSSRLSNPSSATRSDNLSPSRPRSLSTPRTRLSASSASQSQFTPQGGSRSSSRGRSDSNGRGSTSVSSTQDGDTKRSQPSMAQHAMPPYLATRSISPSAAPNRNLRTQQPPQKQQQQSISYQTPSHQPQPHDSHRQQMQEPQFSRVNPPDSRRSDRRAPQQANQINDQQQTQQSQYYQLAPSPHVPYRESSSEVPQPRQPPRQYPQPQAPSPSLHATPSAYMDPVGQQQQQQQPQTRIRSSSGDRGRGADSSLSYGNDGQHDYRAAALSQQRATPSATTRHNFQTPQYSQYQPPSQQHQQHQQQYSQPFQQSGRMTSHRGQQQYQQQALYGGGDSDDEFSQLDYLDV